MMIWEKFITQYLIDSEIIPLIFHFFSMRELAHSRKRDTGFHRLNGKQIMSGLPWEGMSQAKQKTSSGAWTPTGGFVTRNLLLEIPSSSLRKDLGLFVHRTSRRSL
jgi:hypothetical protein